MKLHGRYLGGGKLSAGSEARQDHLKLKTKKYENKRNFGHGSERGVHDYSY